MSPGPKPTFSNPFSGSPPSKSDGSSWTVPQIIPSHYQDNSYGSRPLRSPSGSGSGSGFRAFPPPSPRPSLSVPNPHHRDRARSVDFSSSPTDGRIGDGDDHRERRSSVNGEQGVLSMYGSGGDTAVGSTGSVGGTDRDGDALDRRMSKEWDAAKVPPSQFQRRRGSIFATPSSRDSHTGDAARDKAYHEKLREKGWHVRKGSGGRSG